ncbi:GNAT family N-acetyltransferase [Terribacillus aidingensis]|uniref:GNAT family N-acetyltransferase n=1 Tax=Terribacillus aidingensis TaxID=586416 RepID=UPI00344DF1F7
MYETRLANREELPLIGNYWFQMTREMGEVDGLPVPSSQRVSEVIAIFEKEFDAGNIMFKVVTDEINEIVACAGGLIREEYTFPLSEEKSLFGWVIAVYTLPTHRKNGLASRLVEEVCDWLKDKGAVRARLWSSSSARRMYEDLGFRNMMDMEKTL